MYYPTLEQVKSLADQGNLVPVYREISADLETPVSVYLKVASGDYSILLESVEGGDKLARYSFIGTAPSLIIKTGKDNPVDPLTLVEKKFKEYKPVALPNLPRFCGGFVGYISYDVSRYFEKLPSFKNEPLELPESLLMLMDTLLVYDHVTHRIKIISHAHIGDDVEKAYKEAIQKIDSLAEKLRQPLSSSDAMNLPSGSPSGNEITSNFSKEEYEAIVTRGKEYIVSGDVIQVVLSQRFSRRVSAAPFSIYRELRSVNPSPYMYFLHLDDFYIAGASPELLVRVEGGTVSNHPIAGTRPRSNDDDADARMGQELKNDEKEKAEHIMLVDLGRNDIGSVSEPGTVRVTQLMDVERYSHVMHLVSHVQGKLRKDRTSLNAFRACFPAGTVSGAPKIRAMEIIAELEKDKRGPYAGAIGYFDFAGNLDTAICIRTIIIKDGIAYVQAGAGIVADSNPANEHRECLNKARAMFLAIEQAERAENAVTNR